MALNLHNCVHYQAKFLGRNKLQNASLHTARRQNLSAQGTENTRLKEERERVRFYFQIPSKSCS